VTVIDRNDKNAFVLPTGNIFVFTGLLDFCANDDQVPCKLTTAAFTTTTRRALVRGFLKIQRKKFCLKNALGYLLCYIFFTMLAF
jgi:predicted Zn-dependent protease